MASSYASSRGLEAWRCSGCPRQAGGPGGTGGHPGPAARGATGCAGRGRSTAEIRAGWEWRLSVFKVERESKKDKEHEYWHAAWMGEGKTSPWL